MKLQPVRGTRDILGKERKLKTAIEAVFQKLCQAYGFDQIETPIFESTDVFKRTLGETSDIVGKEMYTFDDRGGDSITLRPEGTAAVVRALISNGLTQTLPQRLYYVGPMFRYERPQKGRYRQFHQACVEYIGSSNPLADVEVIALGHKILTSFDVDVTLHINTLGDNDSRLAYRDALIDYFSKYKDDLSSDSQIRLLKNPMRILDSKDSNDQKIAESAPDFKAYLNQSSKDFFAQVLNGLDTLNIPYVRQNTLVRGLDYYTHTAFEFKTTALGAQDTVLAGGRYDLLVKQMGGPDVPAVGFGMGIERLCLLIEDWFDRRAFSTFKIGILPIQEPDFLSGLTLANDLRNADFSCEFPLQGNLNKRFKQLERFECSHALIFGESELNQGVVKLKDLKTDDPALKERTIAQKDLIDVLRSTVSAFYSKT
ncbi:MAG: Histidine--tRNA ligase [Holosporales bacterium]